MSQSLVNVAKQLAHKKDLTTDVTIGHVGCALLTAAGNVYSGLSVGTAANLGFCAEVCAIADMIKNGETQTEEAVAVGPLGEYITPCGRCRELMFQINRENLKTKIRLSATKSITLEKLLPHRWQDYWGVVRE